MAFRNKLKHPKTITEAERRTWIISSRMLKVYQRNYFFQENRAPKNCEERR
jgi:hypothetical protein